MQLRPVYSVSPELEGGFEIHSRLVADYVI